MFQLNCETDWLVYADWLEDQGLDAAHIRTPGFVNNWCYENDKHYNGVIDGYWNDVGTGLAGTLRERGISGLDCMDDVGAGRVGTGSPLYCAEIGGRPHFSY
jgi:hypothetical protein